MERLLRGVIADMDCIARPDAPVDSADSRFASLLGPVGSFPGHDRLGGGQPLQFLIAPALTAGPANSVRLCRCTATLAPPYLACAAVRLCLLDFDFKRPSILVDEKFEKPPHTSLCRRRLRCGASSSACMPASESPETKADIRRGAFVEIVFRRASRIRSCQLLRVQPFCVPSA